MNTQADLQAMDRALYVFRFIAENSVKERMLERSARAASVCRCSQHRSCEFALGLYLFIY